jgi:hypothetical protein
LIRYIIGVLVLCLSKQYKQKNKNYENVFH